MTNFEELKARANETRAKFRSGEITYNDAKTELKEYIEAANKRAEEIAAKYNQKPKKIRVGDFLKFDF